MLPGISSLQLFSFSLVLLANSVASAAPVKPIVEDSRLSHARELLGKSFKRKVIRKATRENGEVDVSDFVLETTKVLLPKKGRASAEKIAFAILDAAEEFSLDPVFLMAVIQNESSFDPSMRGLAGEIGLMQILPRTAKWIADLYKIEYRGDKSLLDPAQNIWIGAALMDKLRHQFDSEGRLYVSAYNVGPKKLRMLIGMNKNPKIYVLAVMKRYLALYDGFKSKGDLRVLSQKARSNVLQITN